MVKAQIDSLAPYVASSHVFVLYRTDPIFFLQFVLQVRRANRKEGTLLHAQYGALTAFAGLLSKKRSPLMISFGGSDVFGIGSNGPRYWLRNWLTRQLGWIAAWGSSELIVKSDELLSALPRPLRRKASLIPNGVRLHIFSPSDKASCRRQLGWTLEDRIVLFTPGRANNYIVKNSELALSVMECVNAIVPMVRLELIANKTPQEVALMMNVS